MFACISASTDFVLFNSGMYFVADSSTDLTVSYTTVLQVMVEN